MKNVSMRTDVLGNEACISQKNASSITKAYFEYCLENIARNPKKLAIGVTVGLALLGGGVYPLSAYANHDAMVTASRPLIGNPRGTSSACTRNVDIDGMC